MNKGRTETLLMAISGLLWLAMVGLAATGHWLTALYTCCSPVARLRRAGLVAQGAVRSAPGGVSYPGLARDVGGRVLAWATTTRRFLPGATLTSRSSVSTLPSPRSSLLFWIVPTLLMGFGFEAVKDRWLSQERWDEFVRQRARA